MSEHCHHWLNESLPCCDCGDDSDGDDENAYCTSEDTKCWVVFDEQSLRAEIAGRWGEYGAHIDVFDHMLKLCADTGRAAERDRLAARLAEVRGVRNELENSAAAAGLSDAGGAYRRAVRLLDAALLPVGEPAEEEET